MNSQSLHSSMRLSLLTAVVCVLAGVTAPVPAMAAPADGTVDLLATPPELTTTVDPNIVMTFDDSGSMMATSMPDAINGSNGQNYYYSARTNLIYFDPTKTYPPPLRPDGTSFPNASYTNAWRDGLCANAPGSYCYASPNTRDLSTGFYRWFYKTTSSGDSPNANAGTDISTTVRGGSTGNFNGGFYYNCPTPNSNTGCVRVQVNTASAAVKQQFANWYSYYRTRNLLSRTALTRAFGSISGDVRVAWQTINSDYESPFSLAAPALSGRAINKLVGTWRGNFFDWIYNVKTTGSTPNRRAMIQAGKFFERALTTNSMNPFWEPDADDPSTGRNLSCRKNFHMMVTDGYWNDNTTALSPVAPDGYFDGQTNRTLPDGRGFSTADPQSRVIWNVRGTKVDLSMANIAFHYWAKDLQPSLTNNVNPYVPDKSTGVTAAAGLGSGDNPLDNLEIYWNPANNPASWQHLTQFMITLGVAGNLTYPNDLLPLRTGQNTSAGSVGWPQPTNNSPPGVDDTWHAAVNSRGAYFSASNPGDLVKHLSDVLASILSQSAASTPISVSLPLITAGTTGYAAGYNSTDWSGSLTRNNLDLETAEPLSPPVWDASCMLTGGTCPSTGATVAQVLTPDQRKIITYDSKADVGRPFRWDNLSAEQQAALNVSPASINPSATPQFTLDGFGQQRVAHVRGERTYESAVSPRFRSRSSLMGAVIKGEPVYVSSPTSGFRDIFPGESPEGIAAAEGDTYAKYQFDNRSRPPTVYVGSNDGMLHAFDGASGHERWAYVPDTVIRNLHLTRMTHSEGAFAPTVDDAPQQIDAFIDGQWRTYLIGSLRLGGRGVYALDVTQTGFANEAAAAAGVPKWEFSNLPPDPANPGSDCVAGSRYCSSLGYTYDSINVARIAYEDKWVVLVSSGYFPESTTDIGGPGDADAARRTSLLVIDLETGELIKEIPSPAPTAGVSYGLSTATVYDFGSDQIDDVAVAGDLAGNLYRFDLTGDPDSWVDKANLMFTTYGGSVAVGDQPIGFNPTVMRDPATRAPIFVFGTGKYLGKPDRTSDIPQQWFYGVRDYGTCDGGTGDACDVYPITAVDLVEQTLVQQSDTGTDGKTYWRRSITDPQPLTDANRGWSIRLGSASNPNQGMSGSPGERAQRRVFPFYSANLALLYTLVPKSDDPCDPGSDYGFMVVDAASGSFRPKPSDPDATSGAVGAVVPSNRPIGTPVVPPGGGEVKLPGLIGALIPPTVVDAIEEALLGADDVWHRGAWRELLDIH